MTAQPPRGAVLLEALVGAVVFALAALAIVAFQARATQALHHAHFRGEAQQLARVTIASRSQEDGRRWTQTAASRVCDDAIAASTEAPDTSQAA